MKNLITIFVVFVSIQVNASEVSSYYDSLYFAGNKAYQEQNFDTALQHYSEILNSGLESSNLYYNMGNCHYKLQHVAEAILYFEKSLKLDPSATDASYNLKLVNKLIVDEIKSLPTPFYQEWKDTIVNSLKLDTWGYLSIGFVMISMIWLLLYFFTGTVVIKRISFYLFIVFIIGTGITYSFAKAQSEKSFSAQQAIIFATRTNVLSEPNTSSSVLFVIHSGLKVKVLQSQNQWYNIMLPDGSVGWVPQEVAEEI